MGAQGVLHPQFARPRTKDQTLPTVRVQIQPVQNTNRRRPRQQDSCTRSLRNEAKRVHVGR